MKIIALTGSIGSGKTLISSVFKHLGIPVFIADDRAKECYNDIVFLRELEKELGENILNCDILDKKLLADILFSDKAKLDKVSSMIHPKVWESFFLWRDMQKAPYVLMESAIIFEIGWDKYFDKIICIDSPKEISIQRAMDRDNKSMQEIIMRMNNQLSNEEKCNKSDYIIIHNNKTMLLPQILNIHNEIIKNINNQK